MCWTWRGDDLKHDNEVNCVSQVMTLGVTNPTEYRSPNSDYMTKRARKAWLEERAAVALSMAANRGFDRMCSRLIDSGWYYHCTIPKAFPSHNMSRHVKPCKANPFATEFVTWSQQDNSDGYVAVGTCTSQKNVNCSRWSCMFYSECQKETNDWFFSKGTVCDIMIFKGSFSKEGLESHTVEPPMKDHPHERQSVFYGHFSETRCPLSSMQRNPSPKTASLWRLLFADFLVSLFHKFYCLATWDESGGFCVAVAIHCHFPASCVALRILFGRSTSPALSLVREIWYCMCTSLHCLWTGEFHIAVAFPCADQFYVAVALPSIVCGLESFALQNFALPCIVCGLENSMLLLHFLVSSVD